MAVADYKSCDLCGGKAFYDANLHEDRYVATWDPETAKRHDPIGLAVLCPACNKTHEAIIRPRVSPDTPPSADHPDQPPTD